MATETRITARQANQHLSRYLDQTEQGQEIIITRRGHPVAKLVPITAGSQSATPEQLRARSRLRAFLKQGLPVPARTVTRDDMHER